MAKGTTVLEFKQQIAEEAREQGIDYDFDPNMYEPYDYMLAVTMCKFILTQDEA